MYIAFAPAARPSLRRCLVFLALVATAPLAVACSSSDASTAPHAANDASAGDGDGGASDASDAAPTLDDSGGIKTRTSDAGVSLHGTLLISMSTTGTGLPVLYSVSLGDGGAPVALAPTDAGVASWPSFSADGTRIVFDSVDVWTSRADGTDATWLAPCPGQQCAYEFLASDGVTWFVDNTATDPYPVQHFAHVVAGSAPIAFSDGADPSCNRSVAMSPDRKTLILEIATSAVGPCAVGAPQIYLQPTTATQLGAPFPAIDPTVFGANNLRLTSAGDRLYFAGYESPDTGVYNDAIYSVKLDGTDLTRELEIPGLVYFEIASDGSFVVATRLSSQGTNIEAYALGANTPVTIPGVAPVPGEGSPTIALTP